jgi:hypothetical protein
MSPLSWGTTGSGSASGLTKNGHAAAIPISRLGVVGSRNFLPLVLSRSDRSRRLSQESDAVAPQLVDRTGEITPAVCTENLSSGVVVVKSAKDGV